MNKTARHIAHLLSFRNQVCVPGLGCFVSTGKTAEYLELSSIFLPPRLILNFIPGDNDDDGFLLIESLKRRELIDDAEARQQISDDVAQIKKVIAEDGEYLFEGWGVLALKENEYHFVQSADSNSYYTGPTLDIELLEPTKRENAPSYYHSDNSNIIRMAASSIAIIVGFGIVALFTLIVSGKISTPYLTANILGTATQKAIIQDVIAPHSATANQNLVLILNTPSDGAQEVETEPCHVSGTNADMGAYCLIVASLSTESDAINFCNQYSTPLIPLRVLNIDGRYRVFACSGDSYESTYDTARQSGILEAYPSSWICRR